MAKEQGKPGVSWKQKWQDLSPKRRQQLALLGVLGGVGLLSLVILGGTGGSTGPERDPIKEDSRVANSLLPDQNVRDIGMSGLAKDVEGQRDETENVKERINRMEELLRQQARNSQDGGSNRGRDEQMRAELESLREELRQLKETGPASAAEQVVESQPPVESVVGYGGIRTISNQGTSAELKDSSGEYVDEPDEPEAKTTDTPKVYIPSGSIIQGTMLTGLDAPTGKGATKDPVPVLVRIQKEAVLPNRYRADVRECFLLMSGQGDLASERAYLRSETISCVRTDRNVIDLPLKAYAVDTDGKAGLRGRLVSKQGSALSKAILASFADGVSQAFRGNSTPMRFGEGQEVDYGNAGYAGAVMGVSSSLDRISKYYLDLADQLFPILEIDAGREVSLVLVKGMEMAPVY